MITNGNREKQLIIGDIGLIIEGKKVNTHDNLMVTYVYTGGSKSILFYTHF
jgi:hypothetical protein